MKLRQTSTFVFAIACALSLACCISERVDTPAAQPESAKKPQAGKKAPDLESRTSKTADTGAPIGGATMDKNGTIHLMLRAEGESQGQPVIGDALISYRKGDPDYKMVLDHLGGLRPGESKVVLPFPDRK